MRGKKQGLVTGLAFFSKKLITYKSDNLINTFKVTYLARLKRKALGKNLFYRHTNID